MTLHDPNVSHDSAGMPALSVKFVKRTPHVPIRVKIEGREPIEQEVLVDLGSGDGVDVGALASASRRLEVLGGVGLGQEFRAVMGRAEWAEIGPFRMVEPTGATGGVQLIGLEVLRRFDIVFDIVFDYPRSRILLKPNRAFAEPFQHDGSGLTLRWAANMKEFVVHDVQSGSPATESGITTEDRVVAINNRPARDFTIEQVNALLANESGALLLFVRGASASRQVTLKLRKRL